MRLLVTAALTSDDSDLDDLRRLGHEVIWLQDESAQLPPEAYEAEGVVCNALFMHHDPDLFPHMKCVQLTSAGLDRVPIDRLRDLGVQVFNAKGVYSVPMAEWVVLQVLQFYKRSRFFVRNQDDRSWQKARDLRELAGRRACVVGFGDVGKEVARRLRAFDVRIVAVDLTADPSPFADAVMPVSTLADVLPSVDLVVLTLPLTPGTFHLMDDQMLRAMKPDAVLVNVSRGAVVDERALVAALDEGRFSGVALDVFEQEPLPADSPLWGIDRVIVSPHNSFVSDRVRERLLKLVVANSAGV